MKRAQQKEAKILKRFPQIKACSVRIVRSPRIDKMGETTLNYRRSTRIIINSQNRAIQTPQKVNKKGKLTSKSAVKQRSTLKSILIDKKCARRGHKMILSLGKIQTFVAHFLLIFLLEQQAHHRQHTLRVQST